MEVELLPQHQQAACIRGKTNPCQEKQETPLELM